MSKRAFCIPHGFFWLSWSAVDSVVGVSILLLFSVRSFGCRIMLFHEAAPGVIVLSHCFSFSAWDSVLVVFSAGSGFRMSSHMYFWRCRISDGDHQILSQSLHLFSKVS